MLLKVGRLLQIILLCTTLPVSPVNISSENIKNLRGGHTIPDSKPTILETEYGSVLVEDNIVKRSGDENEYRHLTLSNGLKCLLISDKEANKAAASLDVYAGSDRNPRGLEGLAHFLEHLLFMGTSKYPDEAEYKGFLSSHGGTSNAYTLTENTNYHFDVSADYLEGSLDRFAQFFISPLFLESCVERELKAIDSEFMNLVNNDFLRIQEVEKFVSSPEHPFHYFACGNYSSLGTIPKENGIDVRSALIEFYNTHYSANIMNLAVYGKESLDELQSMVISRFSQIPNHNYQHEDYKNLPLGKEHFGKLIRVKTLNEMHVLWITWQIKDMSSYKLYKPSEVLKIICRDHEGSLVSILKTRGWITSMSASLDNIMRGFSTVEVNVGFTKDGISHYKEVIKMVFKMINLLKSSDKVGTIIQENYSLNDIHFENSERLDGLKLVKLQANLMHSYPPVLSLKGPNVALFYDEKVISDFLEQLTVENFRVFLASDDDIIDPKIEKWHGTEYSVESLSQEFLNELSSLDASYEFALPTPNRFIPTNLDTKPLSMVYPGKYPSLLMKNESAKLWYKQDDLFRKATGVFTFAIKSPLIASSARNSFIANLFISVAKYSLQNIENEANAAHLHVTISLVKSQIFFGFNGYSDKLYVFIEEVMTKIMTFTSDPIRFKSIKQAIGKNIRNVERSQSYNLARYYFEGLLRKSYTWFAEMEKYVDEVEADDIIAFRTELFKSFNLETLCYGNFLPEEASAVFERVQSIIGNRVEPIDEKERLEDSILKLEDGQELIYVPPNTTTPNSAIVIHLQTCSLSDVRLRSLNMLYTNIFATVFFDQLRTKEQLGYIVTEYTNEYGSIAGLNFLIQSALDPITLHERIEDFLSQCPNKLEVMSISEYEDYKRELTLDLTEKVINTGEEYAAISVPIADGNYEFDRWEKDAEMLESITIDDMKEFVNRFVVKGAPERRMISIHLWSDKDEKGGELAYAGKDWKVYHDANDLKSQMKWCPSIYNI